MIRHFGLVPASTATHLLRGIVLALGGPRHEAGVTESVLRMTEP